MTNSGQKTLFMNATALLGEKGRRSKPFLQKEEWHKQRFADTNFSKSTTLVVYLLYCAFIIVS